jgi:hypothetical protein
MGVSVGLGLSVIAGWQNSEVELEDALELEVAEAWGLVVPVSYYS